MNAGDVDPLDEGWGLGGWNGGEEGGGDEGEDWILAEGRGDGEG